MGSFRYPYRIGPVLAPVRDAGRSGDMRALNDAIDNAEALLEDRDISLEDYLAGLSTGGGAAAGACETLSVIASSGSSVTLDMSTATVFDLTLTASPVAISFAGSKASMACSFTLFVRQDGTGSRLVTWPTIKWAGALLPVLSTAAGSIDVFSFTTLNTATIFGFPSGFGMA